jgi:hypothetical protein
MNRCINNIIFNVLNTRFYSPGCSSCENKGCIKNIQKNDNQPFEKVSVIRPIRTIERKKNSRDDVGFCYHKTLRFPHFTRDSIPRLLFIFSMANRLPALLAGQIKSYDDNRGENTSLGTTYYGQNTSFRMKFN